MTRTIGVRAAPWRVAAALVLALALAACGGGGDGGAAQAGGDGATECSEHFSGKTVTLTVGYGVGGYDDYARMLAPFLEDELGASAVIVENQEGAGGNIQVNNLADAAPDGLTIGLVNGPGAAGAQLTEQPGVRFAMDEFSWIGRIAYEPNVVVVDADGPLETFEDLMAQEPPTFGAEGPGGTNYLLPSLFREVFPEMSDLEIITGFDAPEIELAIQRGELHAMTGAWDSRLGAIQGGEQRPVLIVGSERIEDKHEAFEGIPAILELDLTDDGRAIMQAFLNFAQLGRPLAAPPGVEEGVLTCLRDAFERAASDEELIAQGQERNRPVTFLSGEEMTSLVDELINDAPEQYLEILRESMSGQ